jgi:hypothetical protein
MLTNFLEVPLKHLLPGIRDELLADFEVCETVSRFDESLEHFLLDLNKLAAGFDQCGIASRAITAS